MALEAWCRVASPYGKANESQHAAATTPRGLLVYRTATFSARRQGGAVQSISAEGDKTALLRFYGYLTRTNRVPEGVLLYLPFMIRADLGDIVQEYASWLQNTQRCKFSTIANYLNSLVSITTYCYANLEPTDQVLQMEPNPLAQIINLRAQAERASKTQREPPPTQNAHMETHTLARLRSPPALVFCLAQRCTISGSEAGSRGKSTSVEFEPAAATAQALLSRHGFDPSSVQKARQKSVEKLDEAQWGTAEEKRFALRDCAALSLLSLIPPDRVGCIRKARAAK